LENGNRKVKTSTGSRADISKITGYKKTGLETIFDKGVGALNEEAFKSSAGALEHIHIVRVNSLLKAVDLLHLNGIQVFTSEMRADKNIHELDLTIPSCIIMGDEGRGVQPYLAKAADYFFKIPMATNFDSFNVSVAAGIILYEAMKQRMFPLK
jgi:23S rRNA (guanosine2251-2'-O)-methyltransferase